MPTSFHVPRACSGRRGAISGLLVVVGLLLINGVVWANNGPHGGYTATTDACAGCHRTHTASQDPLLKGTSIADLCLSCHGVSSGGANTNVLDGRYEATGGSLNGGGFSSYQGHPTTSSHSHDGSLQPAWGSDWPYSTNYGCLGCHSDLSGLRWPGIPEWHPGPGNQPGQIAGAGNVKMPLTCTSCHDPHGGRSYRLLQNRMHPDVIEYEDPQNPNFMQVVSNEPGGLDPDQPGYVPNYTQPRYRNGFNSWCTGCHFLYHQTQGTIPFDAADGNGAVIRYRHAVSITLSSRGLTTTLPLEQPSGYSPSQQADDKIACLTCHFAHGTTATMTGYAANVAPTNDSALLRLDNRGVCQNCHKK